MITEKKTRRRYKRPMRAVSFKFDENLFNQFAEKAKANNISLVQALEVLMKKTVEVACIDMGPAVKVEDAECKLAGLGDKQRMLEKLDHMIQSRAEFIPPLERMQKYILKGKPVVVRFPKFRVTLWNGTLEIIENNKTQAVFQGNESVVMDILDKLIDRAT